MKHYFRTTVAHRRQLRFVLAAVVLFVVGLIVGTATVESDDGVHGLQLITGSLLRQKQNSGKSAVREHIASLEDIHADGTRNTFASSADGAPVVGQVSDPWKHHKEIKKKDSQREAVEGAESRKDVAASKLVPGRGLTCPPYDAASLDQLQIPLKHLPRKKKTSVAEKYNRRAHNCASNGIWNRVTINDHHKILHNMVRLGQIQRDSFVLDWGSGCGHSLQFLYDEYDVTGVGIDVSNLTIAYATENTTKANLHCVADGTKLQWIPDNHFDHALSFGSIYHVYNRTMFCHVLRQLVRVVRPGGTVYNGWTENAEYKRAHIKPCLEDLDVKFDIFEEKKEFADVAIFPLKSQQDTPNTYSLRITKQSHPANNNRFLYENRPIECGVHVCEKRSVVVPLEDEGAKPAEAVVPNVSEVEAQVGKKIGEQEDGGDKEGWPTCPPYDANIERLQIPLEHLPRKKPTSVSQKYDRRANNCASHGIWHRVTIKDHEAILQKIGELLEVRKDDVLFDWGSGCGHQLEFMTRMFQAKGLGIDVSNLTIAYARANTSKENRHCVADGTRTSWLPDNFFDHAYSFGSIYHVYNTTLFCGVLREMLRVVKPGGKVYNGWTEDKEFPRNDVSKCLHQSSDASGEAHDIVIMEEGHLFHNVPNFPLKEHRTKPNTYSLLVTKAKRV